MKQLLMTRAPRLLMTAPLVVALALLGQGAAGLANGAGWMALVEWAMTEDAVFDCPPEAAAALSAARSQGTDRARRQAGLNDCGETGDDGRAPRR